MPDESDYKLTLFSFIYSKNKRCEEQTDYILITLYKQNELVEFKIQRSNDIKWVLDEFYFKLEINTIINVNI